MRWSDQFHSCPDLYLLQSPEHSAGARTKEVVGDIDVSAMVVDEFEAPDDDGNDVFDDGDWTQSSELSSPVMVSLLI